MRLPLGSCESWKVDVPNGAWRYGGPCRGAAAAQRKVAMEERRPLTADGGLGGEPLCRGVVGARRPTAWFYQGWLSASVQISEGENS